MAPLKCCVTIGPDKRAVRGVKRGHARALSGAVDTSRSVRCALSGRYGRRRGRTSVAGAALDRVRPVGVTSSAGSRCRQVSRVPAEVTGADLEFVDVVADGHVERLDADSVGTTRSHRSSAPMPSCRGPGRCTSEVVDGVAPCGALPREHRSDGVGPRRDEDVVMEEVEMNELSAIGTRIEQ